MAQVGTPEAQVLIAMLKSLGPILGVTGVVVVALVVATARAVEVYAKKRLEAHAEGEVQRKLRDHSAELDKDLEKYRSELAADAEATRMTYQRIVQEFGIFAQKRHEVYAELIGECSKLRASLAASTVSDGNRL